MEIPSQTSNGEHRVRYCLWELTLKCNLHCMHCGSIAGRARSRELTHEECRPVADEIVKLGTRELTFIGGEIFLYRGWEQIARRVADQGVDVNIMTNAFGLGEAEIRQIQHARLCNVGISIDGMRENHSRVRGKHSFEHILRAFELLHRADIPIGAITSLLQFNVADLEELYELLLSYGVQVWQLQLVNPMGNMLGRNDLIVRRDQLPGVIEFIRAKASERRMMVLAADSIGYYHGDSEERIRSWREPINCWEGCQAGISSVFIDSVGNVKGCGALYSDVFIEGNVRERSLSEIWHDPTKFAYNRTFEPARLTGECGKCDVGDVCRGGCRASNYFTSGNLYENAFCAHRLPPCEGGGPS
jgi:radical SAM protein with 4Fe4S-binding SPASM domain